MTNETFTFATPQQINEATKEVHSHWPRRSHFVATEEHPFKSEENDLNKVFGVASKFKLSGYYITKHERYFYTSYNQTIEPSKAKALHSSPYFLTLTHESYIHSRMKKKSDTLKALAESVTGVIMLDRVIERDYWRHSDFSGCFAFDVQYEGHAFCLVVPFDIAEDLFGLVINDDFSISLANGMKYEMKSHWLNFINNLRSYSYNYRNTKQGFDYTFDTLNTVQRSLHMMTSNVERFIRAASKSGIKVTPVRTTGIAKTWNRLTEIVNSIMDTNPIIFCAYRTLADYSGKSVEGVKVSSVFNELFQNVNDKEQLIKALENFYADEKDRVAEDGLTYKTSNDIEECVKRLSSYKDKRRVVLKTKANRAFTKMMQEAESLTLDKKKHKLTWVEIEAGNLAIGTFFRKSEQYFLLNDNWDLWEEMFKRGHREQAIALANEVKGRTTYEKDLMSYFYFVLYGLPEYLKKQTGHKWTCIPKLVNTQDELEPPKEGDDGVARTRSALTPTVDNDTKTVVVPYASLAIYGGRGTTYCYSHDYHVLTRGFSFNGYAVTTDVEKALNGRDDYGLMFYTLTGSAQGRGYPTFLIIFERRESKNDTRVHFHRSHPFRSKEGEYNPIHNWVVGCYNWVAGNIKRERIKAQQGDLFFVQVKTDAENTELDGATVKNLEFSYEVNQYDNHRFERGVPFAEYTKAAKSNILGYVRLDENTWLRHNEHDDVLIPAGTYAIHQCRSWEANPKGVWSLRID